MKRTPHKVAWRGHPSLIDACLFVPVASRIRAVSGQRLTHVASVIGRPKETVEARADRSFSVTARNCYPCAGGASYGSRFVVASR
jgi:hypothetical protein